MIFILESFFFPQVFVISFCSKVQLVGTHFWLSIVWSAPLILQRWEYTLVIHRWEHGFCHQRMGTQCMFYPANKGTFLATKRRECTCDPTHFIWYEMSLNAKTSSFWFSMTGTHLQRKQLHLDSLPFGSNPKLFSFTFGLKCPDLQRKWGRRLKLKLLFLV